MIHAVTLMDLHKTLPTVLPTYVVFEFLIPVRGKEVKLLPALRDPWSQAPG